MTDEPPPLGERRPTARATRALSDEERALTEAAIERLRKELGLPEEVDPILPMLPMLLIAWADGEIQREELVAIRNEARADRLAEGWAVLERLLTHAPGPHFRHRLYHLLQALGIAGRLDQARAARILEAAVGIARAAGGLLGFGSVSVEERRELDLLERALSTRVESLRRIMGERASLPIVPEWLDDEGLPRVSVHVHQGPSQLVQVIALHVPVVRTPDRPWAPVIVSLAPVVPNADLDRADVERALAAHAHLPEAERWMVLELMIAAVARPIDDVFRQELLNAARQAGATGEDVVVVDLAELGSIEDELARALGFVAWHPGKIEEVRIDRDVVRRAIAPGTFLADRKKVVAHAEGSVAPPEIPGLRFKRLRLEAEDGTSLRLATPELPDALTPEAVSWLARFLPLVRDPYATLLLDVEKDGRARWSVDMRSSFLEAPAGRPEPLPEGRALVVPPWVWRRVALAF